MHLTESELAALTHSSVSMLSEKASTHLASCPECSTRLQALRADDREVALLLSALDHPTPRFSGAAFVGDLRRRTRRIGAIAAGLALFAAGAAAALPNSPLHHILVRALSKTGTAEAPTTPSVTKTVPIPAKAGVAFLPGGSLDVRFRDPQPGGRLRIVVVEGSRVSATADGDAAFTIHQSQLDVADRGVVMTITLEIPRSVSDVTVRAGNETIFEKHAGAITTSQSIDSTGAYPFSFGRASSGRTPATR